MSGVALSCLGTNDVTVHFINCWVTPPFIQFIPRNMHTVFALLCFVVVIHWLIFPYPSGLLHWHCGNLTIAPVPAKQPWWIWINTSCEFIMNDCITTTKRSTTKPSAYFLGYTVYNLSAQNENQINSFHKSNVHGVIAPILNTPASSLVLIITSHFEYLQIPYLEDIKNANEHLRDKKQ